MIFEQICTLFAFAAAGFILAKIGIVKREHAKILSQLLVYVFMPCSVLRTYIRYFSIDYLETHWGILAVSSVLIVLLTTFAHATARSFTKNRYEQGIYAYSIAIPSIGFMGYPLTERLMGAESLMDAMMFALPMYTLYIYSVGFCNLTKRKFSLKGLRNPAFVPVIIGAVLGLLSFRLPPVIDSILTTGNNCMGPTSMLMAGIVVSEFKIKPLLLNKKAYLIVALRLVIIPLLVGASLLWLPNKDVLKIAVLMYAMPCGLNTIVFPKLVDENCEIGASLAFLSNILACLTIPIVLSLFGI